MRAKHNLSNNPLVGSEDIKILVMSYNALSKEDSNGRTILNYLSEFNKSQVYNLYINKGSLNLNGASSFFLLSDSDVLKSIITRKSGSEVVPCQLSDEINNSSLKAKKKKTCFRVMLRCLLWRIGKPFSKNLIEWLNKTRPNVLVCYSGDFPYFAVLCQKISKFMHIPVVTINTEEYLIKEHDWLSASHKIRKTFWSRMLQNRLFRTYGELYKKYPTVYLTDSLLKSYLRLFPNKKAVCIGNSTSIKPFNFLNKTVNIGYYFGNLSLGRSDSLVKIFAEALRIKPSFRLICYGRGGQRDIEAITKAGIEYRGFVPYEELTNLVLTEADLIIHCEGTEEYYEIDSRNAFSTKIPDVLATGLPTLFYAKETFFFLKYLKENGIKYVATNDDELKDCLRELLNCTFSSSDPESRAKINLVKTNHNLIINGQKFKDIVKSLVCSGDTNENCSNKFNR